MISFEVEMTRMSQTRRFRETTPGRGFGDIMCNGLINDKTGTGADCDGVDIKPALTVEDQILNLKDLGLAINDEGAAAEFLTDVSYYRLKGYCDGLKEVDRKFMAGVTFDTLVKLYEFDSEMRKIIFAGIEKIEIGFRTRLVKFFSLKYGPAGYLVCDNMDMAVPGYRTGFSNDGGGDAEEEPGAYACEIIDGINIDIENNKHNSDIRKYKREYDGGMPPFDVTAEFLSFGQMGKFYMCMKSDDKTSFCREYYTEIDPDCFDVWLDYIIYTRDMCAHHMRIYGAELRHRSTIRSGEPLITEGKKMPGDGIFGVMICMKRILGDKEWGRISVAVKDLFEKYPAIDASAMGFPVGWVDIMLD